MKPLITFCKPDNSGRIMPICGSMDSYYDDGRHTLDRLKMDAWKELRRRNILNKSGYSGFVIYDASSAPWRPMYKTHEEIKP